MNFYIITFGCKVNQYESRAMAQQLENAGYQEAMSYQASDIVIVNSCTVTSTGDAKCRKMLHRVRRENPDAAIVLCGCMPQAFSDNTALFDGCDIVLGNTSRREIVPAIEEWLRTHEQVIRIAPHEKGEIFEQMSVADFSGRTRAYMKIEDGCNRFCSYCIIPYARGRVRSKPLDEIEKEASVLALHGYKEIVLVGINLSAYGQDFGADIRDAVKAVCAVDGVERVRLGSIEPERMTRDILTALSREEKFCPHFHLSLQAGCDATLKRMRRHYTTGEYAQIVADIRELFDNPSITTDVMVGFVGESEEDFRQSVDFCDSIGFAKAHVFPYSVRRGTAAETMDGHIPENVKTQRAQVMIRHTVEEESRFMHSQVGRISDVLFETRSKDGCEVGYTKNYTKVTVDTPERLSGKIVPVRILAAYDDYCTGELVR